MAETWPLKVETLQDCDDVVLKIAELLTGLEVKLGKTWSNWSEARQNMVQTWLCHGSKKETLD